MAALPEIDAPVDLCRPDGRLNPSAVGWTRHPLHRANLRGWGRKKRWEYWAVQSEDWIVAVTVSDLDFAGLHAVWLLDPEGNEHVASAITPPKPLALPHVPGTAPVRVVAGKLAIALVPQPDGLLLRARTPDVDAHITIARPAGHEAMGVVVPWSDARFQYTVKETALPATGQVRLGSRTLDCHDAYATWDSGRGKWPRRITWNWGSGAGVTDGHTVGLQFGGKWTDGTGSNENAIFLDGVCHKVEQDLVWSYDADDWRAPWRVRTPDGSIDVTLTPSFVREDTTNLGLVANQTHQCFGVWDGTVKVVDQALEVRAIRGWAEEVRNTW